MSLDPDKPWVVAEIRTPFEEIRIRRLIPADYSVYLVNHSRSTLIFDPDRWVKDADIPGQCQHRVSIEIESQHGRVMAAVGWYSYNGNRKKIYTIGTFVSASLKRKGLGTALWQVMLDLNPEAMIWGSAASNEGYTLLKSLKERFPGRVGFDGEDSPDDFEDLRSYSGKGRVA